MRSDRGWRRFYAAGWLATAGLSAVAYVQWRAYVHEVEQRAEDAERTREEVARRRAVEERLHIARELHDALTHSISVIKVQAGVAVHLARKQGQQPALVERTRSSGLPTSVQVVGTARSLPTEVDRTAYRVIQEALTNVSRHAGAATATVGLQFATGLLTVRVDDDGDSPREPPVPGHGLIGMQERVTALGGRLRAGPGAHEGFSVMAELPTGVRR